MFKQDETFRALGATAVDNAFITDFMPDANGDYVKVYLYALYASLYPREGFGVAELAHTLGLTESAALSALRYWERRRLISRVSENPPAFVLRPVAQATLTSAGDADQLFVSFSRDVEAVFEDVKRSVRPSEIAQAYEWVQDVGLSQEAVLMLLNHCKATKGPQFTFKAAEKLAVRMKEAGAVSTEDAESYLNFAQRTQNGARDTLRRLGKRRFPSDDELALYLKWLEDWQFSPDAILAACAETVKGEPTFAYLDGVLNGLRTRGDARTGAEITRQLSREKDETQAVRAFAAALGFRGANDMLRTTYRRLRGQFDHEVMLLAATEAQRGQKGVDGCEALLTSWQKQGLHSADAVRAYIGEFRQISQALQAMFEACGHPGRPTAADRAMYKKWRQDWGFSDEMLLLAAKQAANADSKPPYIDKVLQAWKEAGVTIPSHVEARQKPARTAAAQRPAKQVSAQQYTQRTYSKEELDALTNDLLEEARRLNEQ